MLRYVNDSVKSRTDSSVNQHFHLLWKTRHNMSLLKTRLSVSLFDILFISVLAGVLGILAISSSAYADDITIPNTMIVNQTDTGILLRTVADESTNVVFVFDPHYINMTAIKTWFKGEHGISFDMTPIQQGTTRIIATYDNITLSQTVTILASIEEDDAAKNLFVPKHILVPGTYQGVFVRDAAHDSIRVDLAADSDILRVPEYVIIPKGMNHGIFDITTHGIGTAQVIAKAGQDIWKVSSTVHNTISTDYTIQLYLPEKISSRDITSAIYLTDDFDNPVYTESTIRVSLVGTNMDTPEYVTIPKGAAHAFFTVSVYGQGTLTAYTNSSVSDTKYITYADNTHGLNIGVSSELVAANSFGYVFGWITDDNGRIVRPPVPLQGTIHVSGDRVISLGDGHDIQQSSIHDIQVTIHDGIFYKKFYTHQEGTATITVSVPGYGNASSTVQVSRTAAQFFQSDNPIQNIEYESITHLKSTVLPPNTDGAAFLLVSMYHISDEQELIKHCETVMTSITGSSDISDISDTTDPSDISFTTDLDDPSDTLHVILDKDETCQSIDEPLEFPAFGKELVPYKITSKSLEHDDTITFLSDGLPTQTILVPISGSIFGTHDISVSTPGLITSDVSTTSSNIIISEPKKYQLQLDVLPHVTGEYYPIYLISVQDSDGTTIDPQQVFGGIQIQLLSDEIEFQKDRLVLNKPITILYGKSNIKSPSATAIAIHNDIVNTTKSEPISDLTVAISAPVKVHAGELFPVYGYLMLDDKPISDISHLIDTDCLGDDSLYECQQDSAFYIFKTPYGLTNYTVDVFYNTFDKESLHVDFGNSVLYVDSKYTITTRVQDNITIDVSSDIPFEIQGNNIILQPTRRGTYDVVIDFSKEGYIATSKSKQYDILDDTRVNINTYNNDGTMISATAGIIYDDKSETVNTPFEFVVRRGPLHVSFPQQIQIGDTTYRYNMSETTNDQTFTSNSVDIIIVNPVSISAIYKPVITITVNGGIGGGTFDKGDQVVLYAASRDIVSFLIRDVFDRWDGLPAGYDMYQEPLVLSAAESFSTAAIYRTDYTGLIVLVVIGVLAIFVISQRNRFRRR